LKLKIRKLHSL